jgi:NOL1/NOP2/fmu family ribosome biogenesis protein
LQFSRKDEYGNYFIERFDIPKEIIKEYSFWERGKKVWAFTGEYVDTQSIEVLGIKALSLGKNLKPSTAFLRVIGNYARKNVVYLEAKDSLKFLMGENINTQFEVEQGYVIVRNEKDILGCALYKGLLINQIPKKYRVEETWL